MHNSPTGGHSGIDATLKQLKQLVYWKGMNKETQQFNQAVHYLSGLQIRHNSSA